METKKTDEQILKEVITGLKNNVHFDTSSIKVSIEDGEIYLLGFVDSWETKRSAIEIAQNVSGVVKVHSQLEHSSPKKD